MHDALKDSARGSTHGHGAHVDSRRARGIGNRARLRAAGGRRALVRSLLHVLDVDLGYQPARAASMRVDPSRRLATQEQRNALLRRGPDEGSARSPASVPRGLPMCCRSAGIEAGASRAGVRSTSAARLPQGYPRMVSDGYLEALGLRLIAGRDFTPARQEGQRSRHHRQRNAGANVVARTGSARPGDDAGWRAPSDRPSHT